MVRNVADEKQRRHHDRRQNEATVGIHLLAPNGRQGQDEEDEGDAVENRIQQRQNLEIKAEIHVFAVARQHQQRDHRKDDDRGQADGQ